MISFFDKQTRKILRIIILLLAVSLGGILGYQWLEHWSFLDSLYMTIITLTTVGYGEVKPLDPAGQWFTIGLMVSSIGIVAYSITTLASLVIEAEFHEAIWRRKMDKGIKAAHGHFIVCGYGRTGEAVCQSLEKEGKAFVVVENDSELIAELKEKEAMIVVGDATSDESLAAAGIDRAQGLIAALGHDPENVYLVLSARQLNSKLKIVSWADSQEAEQKVIRAGADYVLSPHRLGGARMVQYLLSPLTLKFIDQALQGNNSDIQLDEIKINSESTLIGNSLVGLNIGREIGVVVIGVARQDGEMIFNPPANFVYRLGDTLIGMGNEEQFQKLKNIL